jgi:hypothetical protein
VQLLAAALSSFDARQKSSSVCSDHISQCHCFQSVLHFIEEFGIKPCIDKCFHQKAISGTFQLQLGFIIQDPNLIVSTVFPHRFQPAFCGTVTQQCILFVCPTHPGKSEVWIRANVAAPFSVRWWRFKALYTSPHCHEVHCGNAD